MPPRTSTADDEIRGLYHGPLGDFIAARQALAKRLKQGGDARHDEARQLRKPSLSAWAVNQLFAVEARAMAAFVGAGERARAAQQRTLAGGDAKPLREAIATIRAETARLTGRGSELLAAAERAPGEAIVERLRTNLEALALDPANAAVAARRWLDDDLAAPGFEVMAALQVAAAGAPVRASAGTRRGTAAAPVERSAVAARPAAGAAQRGATVHQLDDARSAAAARKEREARERQERERRARVERLAGELAAAERESIARRQAAERAADAAKRAAGELAVVQRRAHEAAERAREASQLAADGAAAVARARSALAEAESS